MTDLFQDLQRRHVDLLDRVEKGIAEDPNLLADVRTYIGDLGKAGLVISDVEHRVQFRTLVHYWSNFVYGQTGSSPDTSLMPYNRLEDLYQQGMSYFRQEQWADAISTFELLLKETRDYREVSDRLAEAKQLELSSLYDRSMEDMAQKRWEKASSALERILALNPHYRDAREKYAEVQRNFQIRILYDESMMYMRQGSLEKALSTLRRILALDPHYPDVHEKLTEVQTTLELTALHPRRPTLRALIRAWPIHKSMRIVLFAVTFVGLLLIGLRIWRYGDIAGIKILRPTHTIVATTPTWPPTLIGTSAPTLSPTESPAATGRRPPTQTLRLTATSTPTLFVTAMYYRVKPGDTLAGIAARFGITVEAIVEANGLANPNLISVGERLIIPSTASLPFTPTPSTPTPTFIPTRTPTPTTTPTPYPVPQLLGPLDGTIYKAEITFQWTWAGTLAEGEFFAVRVWPRARPGEKRFVAWVRDTSQFVMALEQYESGEYCWNVGVVRTLTTEPNSTKWELWSESTTRCFIVRK